MAKTPRKKNQELVKAEAAKLDKIKVFLKPSVLKNIMKVLTMEHAGFRSHKAVKNINRLFTNLDLDKYKNNTELQSYIWSINFISKQWLAGVVDIDLIIEGGKRNPEWDNIKEGIINASRKDPVIITAPEAKMVYDIVSEALQYGLITSYQDEYFQLLSDIDIEKPGAFKELAMRLFEISKSLMDIKYNTNLVANKVTFNTADIQSVRDAIATTIQSLKSSNNIFKVGIRRLNTLLSPGYMNGRIYVYMGLPGSGKSLMLLKSALDIRKYNPDYVPKTPGMKPCVLYITMENTFTETIERIWNMSFDDSIANYTEEEALRMISKELGIDYVYRDDIEVYHHDNKETTLAELIDHNADGKTNIEIVMKYFTYREINTDDIFTIIKDLEEDNMEVCALVFDYIKRIEPAVPVPDNEKMELNRIMNELKALSVICDIPVITAHQMNRAAASTVDGAARQGKGDVTKLVGREHVGTAWEVVETADWAAVLNIEFKPGTEDRFMIVSVVKRRRIEASEAEFAKYTYLAHPFSKVNGLKLLDDLHLPKVLSLNSLVSDIEGVGKEKTNAVQRLITMERKDYVESDDYDDDDI